MVVLRIATAGSVDDGKSSLIGRLLYDTKAVYDDQLASIESASRQRGLSEVQLSYLTDGLKAERDLNITIDVAYRYFATPKRKFIIADTPGHFEYTRNMVTGTSTADVSVILIDASRGLFEQSRRHIAISSLLGIKHLVFAINKMDLVNFSEGIYRQFANQLTEVASKLGRFDCAFIPISALHGDNVVEASQHTPWYHGPSLLDYLEQADIETQAYEVGLRIPVQTTVEASGKNGETELYALGLIESGEVAVDDMVTVLPQGTKHTISDLRNVSGAVPSAIQGESVSFKLEPPSPIKRGSFIVGAKDWPKPTERFSAFLCWLSDEPLKLHAEYKLLHTTQVVSAKVTHVVNRIHVESFETEPASSVGTNDIVEVHLTLDQPIFADTFEECRPTGSFVLADATTKATCAAGLIRRLQETSEPVEEVSVGIS